MQCHGGRCRRRCPGSEGGGVACTAEEAQLACLPSAPRWCAFPSSGRRSHSRLGRHAAPWLWPGTFGRVLCRGLTWRTSQRPTLGLSLLLIFGRRMLRPRAAWLPLRPPGCIGPRLFCIAGLAHHRLAIYIKRAAPDSRPTVGGVEAPFAEEAGVVCHCMQRCFLLMNAVFRLCFSW